MQLNTGRKMAFGFGSLLALLAILSIVILTNLSRVEKQFRFVVEHDAPVIANARHLTKLVVDMETGQRGFVITGKEEFLEPYNEGVTEFEKLIEEEKDLLSDDPGQVKVLEKIEGLVGEWQDKAAKPEIAMRRKIAKAAIDAAHVQEILAKGVGKKILDEMREIMTKMIESFRIDGNVKGEFLTETIAKAMVDQETGQRGFLITGKEEFLDPYTKGKKALGEAISELRPLVANAHDRTATVNSLDEMESLYKKWRKEAGEPEIELRRQVDSGQKTQKDIENILIQGVGKPTLDKMRKILDRMENSFAEAEHERAQTLLVLVAKAMVEQETGQRGFLITGKEKFLEPYISGQELFEDSINKLRKLNSNAYDIPAMKRDIDKLQKLAEDWQKKAARPEIAAREEMNKHPETLKDLANLLAAKTGKNILDQIREEFRKFILVENVLAAKRYANASATARNTGNITIILALVSIIFGVVIATFITRGITNPVRKLLNAVGIIAKGDLPCQIEIKSKDEIGQLATAFNQMVEDLSRLEEEHMSGEKEILRLNEELEQRVLQRTIQLEYANKALHREIAERHRAEEELQRTHDDLERRVEERTAELHGANEALRKSEEKYQQLYDSAPDMFASVHHKTAMIRQCNQTLATKLGYTKEEIIGCPIFDMYHPDCMEDVNKAFQSFVKTGEVHNAELQLKRKDGTKIEVILNVSAVRDERGNILYSSCIWRDITERKRAEKEKSKLEAQLRQSQKMQAIGTLAGGIAHDFNNILWVIMGNTEMSLRKLPEDSPIRAKQQEILTASKRAKDLVEQILTFSRQKEQERNPLKIHLIVKETLKLLEATLPSTIKIHQNMDKDYGTVMADPSQIHQMIMNLCTNAYQAMGENGGQLEVSLGIFKVNSKTIKSYPELQKGSYVTLTISDTGCGMHKETVERIFDPFFTTKEVGQGTGLGLATVHGIVTSLGGAIKVYSEPGDGSTFHVFLPRHECSESEEPMADADSPALNGNEHILIVDDERQVVSLVQDMLEELGYQITTQTSSVEALKQFRAQPDNFDLIITDQTMPDMTGIDLAEQMLHIRPDIPVILATGHSKMVTEEKIKNSGIREYLKKPMVFHNLETLVRRVLDNKKDND